MSATAAAWDPLDQQTVNKRKARKNKKEQKQVLTLGNIEPKTTNQQLVFDHYDDGKQLFVHGVAGTGKSFVSLYLGLEDILDNNRQQNNLIIVRSAVPSRDLGFMPGTKAEKEQLYEEPYVSICTELFNRSDAYEILKQKGIVSFISTSYLRGSTFDNSIILVDECQNLSWSELDTIITRVGENSRIIFCGDFRQTDLKCSRERSGLKKFIDVCKTMEEFEYVEFTAEDIVRSALVRSYILSKIEQGIV